LGSSQKTPIGFQGGTIPDETETGLGILRKGLRTFGDIERLPVQPIEEAGESSLGLVELLEGFLEAALLFRREFILAAVLPGPWKSKAEKESRGGEKRAHH